MTCFCTFLGLTGVFCLLQLMMNLYGRVFTPLQTAHVHVLAYPYECSALSVLDAIATGAAVALGHFVLLNPCVFARPASAESNGQGVCGPTLRADALRTPCCRVGQCGGGAGVRAAAAGHRER